MRRTFRAAVGVTAALVLVLGVAAAPAGAVTGGTGAEPGTADTSTNGWRPTPPDWRPCLEQPDSADLRCATLLLPVDWSRPRGATFPLEIVRRAATGPAASRIGVLLTNPGGPGGSGVDALIDRPERYGSAEVREHFDLIGFDPRGVGRSNPIRCSAQLLAELPFPVPADERAYRDMVAYNHRLYENCRAHTGPLLDHADTVNVAHDMDAIRAALGERQISYNAASYGTLMGQMYAERYPNRVRAMVLDSVMDHSLGTAAFIRTEAVGAENAFEQFVAWCARETGCVLHGRDVPGLFDRLMRRAEAGDLVDPRSGRTLTWFDLSAETLQAFYDPRWSELADRLATLAATDAATDAEGTGERGGTAADEPVPFAMPMFCQDWALPVDSLARLHRYVEMSRAVAPHMRGSAPALMATGLCLDWQGPVGNPQHRLRVRTDLPLLVVNSRHDPITPYEWAVNVADQLGRNGRLVTFEGPGHGVYPGTPCLTDFVDRYLIDRTLPRHGAVCAAPAPTARPYAAERTAQSPAPTGPWTMPPVR
ncbi:alpha/beta hydrolase [Micromonospora sp. NPDC050397]|uniref:alpha/beta hydrolase n=1 Tax=Micromonospora sp. NPDC050397 TaxID=3364279 RepID=UPI00384C600F